jgi:hypothetical protein
MQSQLQTVINNSLSSSIALTGILPQMQSTAVTTDRNGNKDGGHRIIRGSKEGYSRQDIRVVNKNTRSSNQQRIVAFEPGNDMFVKYLY